MNVTWLLTDIFQGNRKLEETIEYGIGYARRRPSNEMALIELSYDIKCISKKHVISISVINVRFSGEGKIRKHARKPSMSIFPCKNAVNDSSHVSAFP